MHTGEGSSLLNLLIQMLTSSEDPLPDTPRNNVLSTIWVSLSPLKLTHNHHGKSHDIIKLGFKPKQAGSRTYIPISTHSCLVYPGPSLCMCGGCVKQDRFSQDGVMMEPDPLPSLAPSGIYRTRRALPRCCLITLPEAVHLEHGLGF